MKNLSFPLLVVFSILWNGQAGAFAFFCKDIVANSALQRLKEYLFCDYDSQIRPTENYRNATVVHFGLHVHQFQVDEISSTVDFNVWLKMVWTDTHLSWVPSQFDDIQHLEVTSYEIWTPDVVMHSATNAGVDMEMPPVRCKLYHQGTVFCVPSTVYSAFCPPDYTWWPHDVIDCSIDIASWSHSEDEIDLRFTEFETDGQLAANEYEKNPEWQATHISQSERRVDSKFGPGFAGGNLLSYHVVLKRHSSSMYATIYLSLTAVLTSTTLTVLWLEPTSTERTILANLNFILHLLSLHDLHWKLPSNAARPPELILLYEASLLLATFSLVLTSILRCLHDLKRDAPPVVTAVTLFVLNSEAGQVLLPEKVARDRKLSPWSCLSILIGWLALLGVSIAYAITFIAFLPTSNRSTAAAISVS